MGKQKEIEIEDAPAVRTIYDRRKHESLLPDGASASRILVKPGGKAGKLSVQHAQLPLYACSCDDEGGTPIKPLRKFVPKTPTLPESSFGKKWERRNSSTLTEPLSTTEAGRGFLSQRHSPLPASECVGLDQEKDSKKATSSRSDIRSPRPNSSSDSDGIDSNGSGSGDSSKINPLQTDACDESELVYESTPVVPFDVTNINGADNNPLPVASGSSSSTSTSSNQSEDASDEKSGSSFCQKDIVGLFKAPSGSNFGVSGMNADSRPLENFYYLSDPAAGDTPVLKYDFNGVLDDLKGFVKTPVPFGCVIRCTVSRCKRGMDRNIYPTYFLYLEENNNKAKRILILTARKRKRSTTSNYLMSIDPADLSRGGKAYVGKVRSNLVGTQFTIFDSGNSPKKFNFTALGIDLFNYRQELGLVIYEPNVLGFKGPRRMRIILPTMLDESHRWECRPDVEEETIIELNKKGRLPSTFVELRNKYPSWNIESQSFVLNFQGRVTQASVKNFQIIHEDRTDYILLQFGRIDDDNFTLDFRYPMCPLQAFGIALSSFDNKLACE